MDFLFHRRHDGGDLPRTFDFLDIQDEYLPHFTENKKRLGMVGVELNFVHANYDELQTANYKNKYDLIVTNPPYFMQGQGKLSPSEFKNRCRFFIDSSFKNLILGIAHSLKSDGIAYLLIKDLPEHGWDMVAEAQKICADRLEMRILGEVRGIPFISLAPLVSTRSK